MSYPTNDNSKWEPPEVETLVLPPRRRSIIREEQPDGKVEEKDAPLERWNQPSLCPCKNPSIMVYSLACCCCAMGDIGCYVRENWLCYPAYCIGAPCPCCVGDTREKVAEKYNLPILEWEPDNCGWCLVKLIGTRLMCFATVCLLPCFHVAQMRAEIAYRRHGKPTVWPCCCCWCGGGEAPGESTAKGKDLDYPRDADVKRKDSKKEEAADYPRAGGKKYDLEGEKKVEEVGEDYPHAGGKQYVLESEKGAKVLADYPKASGKFSHGLESGKSVKFVADYPHAGAQQYALGSSQDYAPPVADYPHAGAQQYDLGSQEYGASAMADYPHAGAQQYALGSQEYVPSVVDYPHAGAQQYGSGYGDYRPPVADYPR